MIIKSEKSSFESYLTDAANISGNCEKVYFPENLEDIVQILEQSNRLNERITISAARTGLNGGSVPDNGILVSTEKLNKIISIDYNSKSAIVEPGITLIAFQQEIEKAGLFYPPDPTEINCSIGGTVANNASGARTFKYGPTRNYVQAIKVMLADGYDLTIDRGEYISDGLNADFELPGGKNLNFNIPDYKMPQVKHSAGYFCKPNMDLIDLFIGSEGTLGFIYEIKLQLLHLPENVLSIIVFFNDENNLHSFVDDLKYKSSDQNNIIDLREIEFFDENTLKILKEDYENIPENSLGAVWIEQEYKNDDEEVLLSEIESIVDSNNGDVENIWYALNENERGKLKEFRHEIALKVNDIISSRGLIKVGTDTAVPYQNFHRFYDYTKSLLVENNIDYVVYGHIGNCHLHFNMLPKTKTELSLCRKLYGQICTKSIELEGTISAEHGIGKLKKDYLLEMFGEDNILKMAKLKKIFDPNFILNVGNIFDEKFLYMV